MSTPSTTPSAAQVAAARASFDRIASLQNFFPEFYQRFFAQCPAARPMFAKTNFEHQHRLLKHAIGLLLAFAGQGAGREPNLLSRVADRHGREDLGIPPDMYDPFVDALVDNVRHFDAEFTPDVEAAWRTTLAPGVEYMKTKS